MEGIIHDGVVDHMEENSYSSRHQHGFINGHSTVTLLLETHHYWSQSLGNGEDFDAIYLDFQ